MITLFERPTGAQGTEYFYDFLIDNSSGAIYLSTLTAGFQRQSGSTWVAANNGLLHNSDNTYTMRHLIMT
ncbi:MAG: hypothetical protein LBB91_04435, partial [Clostridiales bacterium]|nr:hypothetical protein [Clostridiales bacterium]